MYMYIYENGAPLNDKNPYLMLKLINKRSCNLSYKTSSFASIKLRNETGDFNLNIQWELVKKISVEKKNYRLIYC